MFTDRAWSREEILAFEDAIALHGPELRAAKEEVPHRSMPEVVRFFGHWKKYVSLMSVETSNVLTFS